MNRFVVLLALAAGLLLPTIACGGGNDAKATVDVELGEWFVTPNQPSVSAGKVTFVVENTGGLVHDFRVLKTDLAPDELPISIGRVDEAAAGTLLGTIEQEELGPLQSASITLDLNPGNYVLICNVPGHYLSRMTVGFRVQ